MTPPDPGQNLAGLLKRIRGGEGMHTGQPGERAHPRDEARPEGIDPLLWHLIYSLMLWEAGTHLAEQATARLHAAVVDYNELRVCLADEVRRVLGDAYPLSAERACRLRAVLNDIYRREHRVTLEHLPVLGRREARQYLESLEGMPQFVAARVALLSLDAHAFPLDERMRQALLSHQALPPDLDLAEAAAWLERQFRAREAAPAYLLLEAWIESQKQGASPPPSAPRGSQAKTRKRTRP